MTITIAGNTFPTRKPRDLDDKLVAATGCNAAENLAIISGYALPGRIAAAVHPFLPEEAPTVQELAAMIEVDLAIDGNTIADDAKRLFSAVDVTAADKNEKD